MYIGQDGDSITDRFANRGFLASNALPIKKGEHYAQLSLIGPNVQLVPFDQFEIGIMSSWFTAPLILSLKYNIRLSRRSNIGLNLYVGTGHWVIPDQNAGLANIV